MESVERFTQNQRIIEEFVAQWLAHQPCTMARLAHVATLHDAYTGLYGQVILEQSYSKEAVHESLLYCDEELFEKILECSFPEQEGDLRRCFENRGIPAAEIARRWLEMEFFRCLVPYGTLPCNEIGYTPRLRNLQLQPRSHGNLDLGHRIKAR